MLSARWTLTLLLACAATCSAASAQTSAPASGPAVELGEMFTDLRTGVSLRGPAGADMERLTSKSLIVRWVKRDAKANAISWVLNVQKNNAPKGPAKDVADQILATLKQLEKLDSPSMELVKVDGKDSFIIRSAKGDAKARFWEQQVWVQLADSQFMVFVITGPENIKGQLDAIMLAVLDTVKFMDPKAIAAIREENLKRGADLLASLDDKKFAPSFNKGMQWFRMIAGGKTIGFLAQSAEPVKVGGQAGMQLRIWMSFKDDTGHLSTLKRMLQCSFDRSSEQWNETLTSGKETTGEEGSKQGDQLTAKTIGAKPVSHSSKVPEPNYLPRGMGVILPALIDLTKGGNYAFLAYSTEQDRFNTRTLTVVGPETIKIDGREVKAIRLSDQTAMDAAPMALFVDDKGFMLRLDVENGLTMEAASLDSIVKEFPEARDITKD